MCGRYGRITRAAVFAEMIDGALSEARRDAPSYNQPPGTFAACALRHPDSGEVTLGPAWWGFVPNWASDTKLMPINARSETAGEKKLFAKAFAHQRCLIAADWYYEWQRQGNGKQPFAIRPAGGQPFFFAGIWSKAQRLPQDYAAAGQVTFAILTGPPADDIAPIHNRQPQALTRDAARAWLSDAHTTARRYELLQSGRYSDYEIWPVTKSVGNPANDYPDLIKRVNPA